MGPRNDSEKQLFASRSTWAFRGLLSPTCHPGGTPVSGCTLLLFWSGGGAPWRSAVCQVSRCFWAHACVLPVDGAAHVWRRASAGRARLCAWRQSFGQAP